MDSGEEIKGHINSDSVLSAQGENTAVTEKDSAKKFTPVTTIQPQGELATVRHSIASASPEFQTTYKVKLFHPYEDGNSCQNIGKSVRFDIPASDQSDLRTKIESNVHGFFKGDCCEKCGALAKVSF